MNRYIAYILTAAIFLLSGCSTAKRHVSSTPSDLGVTPAIKNITATSFDISRFTLYIDSYTSSDRFLGFIKHRNHNYLISIRNFFGIEYMRGLVSNDNSVTIVIRLLQIAIPTTIDEIKTITGIDLSMLPLLFGEDSSQQHSSFPYNVKIDYDEQITINNYQYSPKVSITGNGFSANILYENISLQNGDDLSISINDKFKIVTFAEFWNNIISQ